MTVCIEPLPAWARGKRHKPHPRPVFVDGVEPTAADFELALALFAELDPESQAWYGGGAFVERLRARLASSGNIWRRGRG